MPEPFKVEGVDYSSDGIEELRLELIEWRGKVMTRWSFDPEAIDETAKLTHVIALLAYLAELEKPIEPLPPEVEAKYQRWLFERAADAAGA